VATIDELFKKNQNLAKALSDRIKFRVRA